MRLKHFSLSGEEILKSRYKSKILIFRSEERKIIPKPNLPNAYYYHECNSDWSIDSFGFNSDYFLLQLEEQPKAIATFICC